jgi:hypothetical protein
MSTATFDQGAPARAAARVEEIVRLCRMGPLGEPFQIVRVGQGVSFRAER